MEGRGIRIGLGTLDVALGLGLAFCIWQFLPARWWVLDWSGSSLAVLLVASGVGLCSGKLWAHRLAQLTAWLLLLAGLVFCTLLVWTASYLSGVYGNVGRGGAALFSVAAVVAVPYLVIFPAAHLWMLQKRA